MEFALIFLSIAALFSGPMFYALTPRNKGLQDVIDGFIFIVITGLVGLELVPSYFQHGGYIALACIIAGVITPSFIEKVSRRAEKEVHKISLALGVSALVLHAVLDGTVLVQTEDAHSQLYLALAIILHRFPVSLTIWWLLKPRFSTMTTLSVFAGMSISTLLGYWFGVNLMDNLHSEPFIWLQSFITGSVIHVILHKPHPPVAHVHEQHSPAHKKPWHWHEGLGNIVGFLLLYVLMALVEHHTHAEHTTWFTTFYHLLLHCAPALLMAYTFGSLLRPFLPTPSVPWLTRGNTLTRASKGTASGLPMPACSCGVAPLYQVWMNNGTPTAAAFSFLIATPALGIDTIILSIPLLGPDMTLLRIAAVILLAVCVGFVMSHVTQPVSNRVQQPASTGQQSIFQKLQSGLSEGYINLFDHTSPWVLFGLMLATSVLHFNMSHNTLVDILPYHLDILLLAVLGIPAYVCASGATPLLAVLVTAGLGPGAALAFLLTGPASNAITFNVIRQFHGKKIAGLFGFSILITAVLIGLLTDHFFHDAGQFATHALPTHDFSSAHHVCLSILVILFGNALLRNGMRSIVNEVLPLQKLTLGHKH